MLSIAAFVLALAPVPAGAEEEDDVVATAPVPTAPTSSDALAPADMPGAPAVGVSTPAAPATASNELKVRVSLDHSVGTGTFVRDYYAYIAAKLAVSPSYAFEVRGVKLSASAKLSGSFEYTPPEDPTGRRVSWGDIGLDLSAPGFFTEKKLTGISFSANVGATIPISLQSRWASVITGLSAGISGERKFGKFTVEGRFGASKTLFATLERRLPEWMAERRDAQDHTLYICRSDPNGCLITGEGVTNRVPPLWSMSGGVSGSYSPTDKLSFSIGWSLGKTFKFPVGVDDLSTQARYTDGTLVADAQGHSDRMVGSVGASYQLTRQIGVSFEVGTIQAPLTADGKALRFPFFAFRNIEDSFTSYSLAISGTY